MKQPRLHCLASPRRAGLVVMVALVFHGMAAQAEPPLDASHYVWRSTREAGSAVMQLPYGGEYIYSSVEPSDGRIEQRFLIGKPRRTEFELFSADEEAALWLLRDRELHPGAYLERRRPRRAPQPLSIARHASLDWPKVVVRDGKTCVPESAFANAPDWASHLICWLGATREVTHE